MTLEEAIPVLNEHSHLGIRNWRIDINAVRPVRFAIGDTDAGEWVYREAFEAIAIAEKYVRDETAPQHQTTTPEG